MPPPVIVAVDAMGGDHAPSVVIEGALQAVALHDLTVALVGPTSRLEAELAQHGEAGRLGGH